MKLLLRHLIHKLWRAWAGPDPLARPHGFVFRRCSSVWRTIRSQCRKIKRQPEILFHLDHAPELKHFGCITGWLATRNHNIELAEVWCGSQFLGRLVLCEPRPDVALWFPKWKVQKLVGFRFAPPPELLQDGKQTFDFCLVNQKGVAQIHRELVTIRDYFAADEGQIDCRLSGTDRYYQHLIHAVVGKSSALEVPDQDLLSIVMPVYRPNPEHFHQAIESIRNQSYPNWQLCLCDDGSNDPSLTECLTRLALEDPRIRCVRLNQNQGISVASQSALFLTEGSYVALMDQDDLLHPEALAQFALIMQSHQPDLIYCDEDRLNDRDERVLPILKPDWSPELLRGKMYLGHLCAYRRELIMELGFRSEFDGTQDWDLALRAVNHHETHVVHIPRILYHWRMGGHSSQTKGNRLCHARGKQAVLRSIAQSGERAVVEDANAPSAFRIRYQHPKPNPLVSVLIPSRNRHQLLGACLYGLRKRTSYEPKEIIVVDNGSDDPRTLAFLDRVKVDQLLHDALKFNHSRLTNLAAQYAKGEFLLLLNDDIQMIHPDWLDRMMEQARRPHVGAVGALLHFPDGRIQHAGIVLGEKVCNLGTEQLQDGLDRGMIHLTREVSAITGACLLIRRDLYFELGGLDEERFPTSFNDVDLCLKIRKQGLSILLVGGARLIHHESASRKITDQDVAYLQRLKQKWGALLSEERYSKYDLNRSFQLIESLCKS